ncbi:MAG: aldose 1-epimerase family protein, partial [Lachnospiraceae bacterium]
MEYIIQNRYLRVMISSIGAELQSIRGCNGTEYLWQGDARTWADRAPNIFPYVARLTEGKYKYREKEYKMDIHGFLPQTELVACKIKDDRISFRLSSNDNIRKSYPFEFTYLLHYKLEERKICIIYEVRNEGEEKMYFGLGGHPGFCVPNEKGLAYTDYYLEFEKEANPRLIEMTDTCFVKGSESEFPLRDK